MRVLVFDENTAKDIQEVKKYAAEHVYNDTRLAAIKNGKELPPGDNPDHVVHIHDGYRTVFTYMSHEDVLYQHLSVSVGKEGKYPHPIAVSRIMEAFGMGNDLNDCYNVWLEEDAQAVNVLKKVEDEN
jgi:hypothetical protein